MNDEELNAGEVWYCKNIAIWFDGTLRPAKGHHGGCRWFYDGQVFYHLPLNGATR